MGEFLRETSKNKGASAGGKKVGSRGKIFEPRDSSPTLADLGISKLESSDAQALAILKDEAPDLHEKVRDGEVRVDVAAAEVRRKAKRVADLARAAEVYARRQKLGEEAERHATRIKVDALTLMGEFLREAPKNRGTAGKGRPVLGAPKIGAPKDPTPTLAALGVTFQESSEAQALAVLKDEDPDLHEKVRDGEVRIDVAAAEVRRKARERVRREKAASVPEPPVGCWRKPPMPDRPSALPTWPAPPRSMPDGRSSAKRPSATPRASRSMP
jgi:predicted phage tail protein